MNDDDLASRRKELEEDDLLRRLVPDPNNADVSVLTGTFLGRGSDENTLRVYTTMDLTQYFQVPKDKVLGAKRMPSGQIVVWVPGELRVQLTTSQTMPAEFLKGSIQAAFLSRARRTSSFGSLGALARQQDPQPSAFGGPFCQTDIPDPTNPICGLTASGCPPAPGC